MNSVGNLWPLNAVLAITQPRKKFIQIVGMPNYLVQKNKVFDQTSMTCEDGIFELSNNKQVKIGILHRSCPLFVYVLLYYSIIIK